MAPSSRPLVSVVLSFRNEAANIPELVSRLSRVLGAEVVEYELVFVNDASTDNSLEILSREHAANRRVKVVNMSRKFGVAECALAGMAAAKGAAVIYMDADLQDPPEVIPALLAQWRAGAEVVHTVRTARHGENALKMWVTKRAYEMIQVGATIRLPVNAGDFKLLSRTAVDHLLQLGESDPYLRGMVVWLGFRQVFVPYERDARFAGATHYPFWSRNPWKTFLLGMTSFSFMPVYVSGVIAAAGLATACILLLTSGAMAIAGVAGAGTLAFWSVLLLLWAATMVSISAVGIYVVRIYKDVRRRPPFVIESSLGIEAGRPTAEPAVAHQDRPS